MTKLDKTNINFISNANLVFVSKESEDGDSRITKISEHTTFIYGLLLYRNEITFYKTGVKT